MRIDLIPLSGTDIVEFTPSQFKEGDDPYPRFFIRVPTFAMKDKMGVILFQRGYMPVTQAQGRGILIDALYELYPEPEADDHAAFLEDYWTRSELHQELVQAWSIREAQRLFDVAHGVNGTNGRPKLEQEPIPPAPYKMRDQARQARLQTYVLENHDGYRNYQSRFMAQNEEEQEIVLRLFIGGWSGVGDVEAVRDDLDRLTPESIEGVRKWLAEAGAPDGWDEVKHKVLAQFGGNGGLEKNFDLPLDTNSSQTGSPIMNDVSDASDGSSTTLPTTPTRNSKSRPTSGGSRNSRSSSKGSGKTRSRKPGRTGGRS